MPEHAELRGQPVREPGPSTRKDRCLRQAHKEVKEQLKHATEAEKAHSSDGPSLPSDHSKRHIARAVGQDRSAILSGRK